MLESLQYYLESIDEGSQVILKLTLPATANHYLPLTVHPKVMRVVALSGGYSRKEANQKLSENKRMIASFSRALTEGLNVQQADDEFELALSQTIADICTASAAG